ncbi:MAG: restriction endonuclease subunit S [Pseudomonadota bacterium]|nr:restriction endonuclease subunit S [Pseudomonadota bacterium]
MSKYLPYDNYKNTGVEFLNELPRHWIMSYLKRFCDVTDGSHHSPSICEDGMPFVSVTDVGVNDINFEDSKKISLEDYDRLVREGCKPSVGEVLLTKDGTIGRAVVVDKSFPDFVVLSSLGILSPKRILQSEFLYYYLVSGINVDQMNSMIHGSALRRMTISKINDLVFVLPPKLEQQKIANFLDHETAKIDTLIEKQQQLIKLLKEKRQAVISHAVTKGLNPNAPMRDSGVEWLGEVPEHWGITYLTHLVDTRRKIMYGIVLPGPNVDDGVLIIKGGDVKPGRLRPDMLCRTTPEIEANYERSRLKEGDLVYSIRGTIGDVEIVPQAIEGANLTQDAARIAPKDGVDNRWLRYTMESTQIFSQLEIGSLGAAVKGINICDLKKAILPEPPSTEMTQIANFLDQVLEKMDLLSEKANAQVNLLQERRTALISAAVTGKIDVRNWQPPADSSANHTSEPLAEVTP